MLEGRADDQRGIDGRVLALERQYSELTRKVDLVSNEQSHLRELVSSRFGTIEKGLELVSSQVTNLSASIQMMASDSANSPAGRALSREIADIKADHAKEAAELKGEIGQQEQRIDTLQREADEARGAIKFAGRWAVAGVLTALAAILLAALKLLGVGP